MDTVQVKKLVRAGDWSEAMRAMRAALSDSRDPDLYLRFAKYIAEIPPEAARAEGWLVKRVAILGGYTTSFTTKALVASLFRRGILAQTWESEYGLLETAVRFQEPALAAFQPDVCYFATGSEHIQNTSVGAEAAHWMGLWQASHKWLECPIVQNTFLEPTHRVFGNFELKNPQSRTRFIRGLNLALVEQAPGYVHFSDLEFMASVHGRKNWRDEKYFDVAKLPVAQTHLVSESENTASVIAALFGITKKCLVLDLDNTLWGGVIGDDGLGGIKIGEDSDVGEGFKRFQSYILELKKRGVILAVCSKNEESNAKEPFEKRTDMVLSLADISCFVANWEPKHLNIQRIARELNIGLDAMVFADDNPAEREIVRQNLPEVSVIEMPLDPAHYTEALASSGLFETVSVTDEDRVRTEQYLANSERTHLERSAGSYQDYLKSLDMTAVVQKFDSGHLPRITQLINKTNQFNLTTRRYSESETQAWMENEASLTRYIKLRDRFGDNGLIAIFIARPLRAAEMEIDTWLMSCRVLKRDVERLLMSEVILDLHARKIEKLFGVYLPTKKNGMVKDLLPNMGFTKVADLDEGGERWCLDIPSAVNQLQEVPIQIVNAENYSQLATIGER